MNTIKIGLYKGKEIADMDKDQLLDFAKWVVNYTAYLQNKVDSHMELDLKKEAVNLIKRS